MREKQNGVKISLSLQTLKGRGSHVMKGIRFHLKKVK